MDQSRKEPSPEKPSPEQPLPQLLTIDCGNSTIRCRRDDGLVWATDSTRPDFASLATFVGSRATRAVAVSVVPAALAATRSALAGLDVAIAVADDDLPCPMPLAYDTVATLGADRWLGAFAAHTLFGGGPDGGTRAVITIDCGTATTVNVVDRDGVFHGGAIAPGLAAFVAGLAAKAPALPAADLDADPVLPAKSTQACVDSGVLLGWAGLVERLVAGVQDAFDGEAGLVLTGGNATRLLRLSDIGLAAEHVPDLIHDGLVALAGVRPAN